MRLFCIFCIDKVEIPQGKVKRYYSNIMCYKPCDMCHKEYAVFWIGDKK